MTRDYARKSRPAASRKRPAPKPPVPVWIWLLTGAACGAFVMLLIYLAGMAPTAPAPQATAPTPAKPKVDTSQVPKPRFDFYQILKETEVSVPGDAPPAPAPQMPAPTAPTEPLPLPGTAPVAELTVNGSTNPDTPTAVTLPGTSAPAPTAKPVAATSSDYILQVGSFKTDADAERMRAQLILLNLPTYIEKVNVRNGEVWHRVLVGPFSNLDTASRARSSLVSAGINPLLLKGKNP